jgi:hypothetical protein
MRVHKGVHMGVQKGGPGFVPTLNKSHSKQLHSQPQTSVGSLIGDRAIFTKRQGRWKTGQGKNFFQSP